MCKTTAIIVEIIENKDKKRTYVVRELSGAQQPPKTLDVFDDADALAQFLSDYEI